MEVSKEIPKELVAKIYALYYSADCYHYEGWKAGSTERVCSNHILGAESVGIKYGQLILRSLEDITDGECIEIAKMHYPYREEVIEKGIERYVRNVKRFVLIPVSGLNYAIIDYLRSQSFMLPAYGIQDLFEAGVAERKEVGNG